MGNDAFAAGTQPAAPPSAVPAARTRTPRFAPRDRQCGSPLGGPLRFAPPRFGRPERVACVGVEPQSYLRKGVLWEVFGVHNVRSVTYEGIRQAPEDALAIRAAAPAQTPSWSRFVEALGARAAAVDIGALAAMLRAENLELAVTEARVDRPQTTHVFRSRIDAPLHPDAPRVRFTGASRVVSGFGDGDECHLYGRDGRSLVLRTLTLDPAREEALRARGLCVRARLAGSRDAAVLEAVTPAGGQLAAFDMGAADRVPEPSGSETVATQILLSALGVSPVIFGKFTAAEPEYEAFVELAGALARTYPDFAWMERIGHSEAGRDLWALRIARDRDAPIVLYTTGIHPLEWAPAYGLLRYLRFLLSECEAGSNYARDLLTDRQVCWVLSCCPDGWETRDLQSNGINLERNFPESWEPCRPNDPKWDAYNRQFMTISDGDDPDRSRGPAPLSQPETAALHELVSRTRGRFAALADFHETTAPKSFLHQVEREDGTIPDMDYHRALTQAAALAFNGRFYAHTNVIAFRPALNDFSTWTFRGIRSLDRLMTKTSLGWICHALNRGVRSLIVESEGCDCTHYQTIRRTEYAALVAEQMLAAERGGILRNPWGADWEIEIPLLREARTVQLGVADKAGRIVLRRTQHDAQRVCRCRIPPGGWVRWANSC